MKILAMFEHEARASMREFAGPHGAPGSSVALGPGALCVLDGIPGTIVGWNSNTVIVRQVPDLKFLVYVQRKPGDAWRLVGATTDRAGADRMADILKNYKLPAQLLPFTENPKRKLRGYEIRMLAVPDTYTYSVRFIYGKGKR